MGIPLSRCHNAHDGIPRAIQRYLQCCIRRPKRDLLEAGFLTPRTTSTLALIPINHVIISRVGMKPKMMDLPSHRSQPPTCQNSHSHFRPASLGKNLPCHSARRNKIAPDSNTTCSTPWLRCHNAGIFRVGPREHTRRHGDRLA